MYLCKVVMQKCIVLSQKRREKEVVSCRIAKKGRDKFQEEGEWMRWVRM